jgi:peptide-methionine (R)-S-oxide reductase
MGGPFCFRWPAIAGGGGGAYSSVDEEGAMGGTYAVTRSEAEWRRLLTPEQFTLLRERGAERPNASALVGEKRVGTFSCVGCDAPLFESAMKFESGTGWPSFSTAIHGSVETIVDDDYPGGHHAGYGTVRTELICATCGSHIGHVFEDGPPPSGLRYCANGIGLKFTPA